MGKTDDLIGRLAGGLIVSVQAQESSPLCDARIIAALAKAVAGAGCVGLRINSPEHIRAVRAVTALPIIGIWKSYTPDGRVWITPTLAAARACLEAGASIVALDATAAPRACGEEAAAIIAGVHALGALAMADVSTLQEGLAAARAGADLVASTLSGYVTAPKASPFDAPDLALVAGLVQQAGVPVIAEGRYNTPELARRALEAGAHAVVVGSAITRPEVIAAGFVRAMAGARGPR